MRDECFIRGNVPMTKSEVRAVSLSKMEIRHDSIIYDVGAGTGSVSVEAAMMAPQGQVYAFEQKEEACGLIEQNREKFRLNNLTVIPGKAPESMREAPAPDCVFLGGSGGKLAEILDLVLQKNPSVRIVINVIVLESLAGVLTYLKQKKLEAEIVTVQVSRAESIREFHMMQALNPVTVIAVGGSQEGLI